MSDHPVEPSIAAAHALHLAELVTRWGVTREQLFEGLGLDEEAVSDPRRRVSIAVLDQLAARAKALTGEPGLGFYFGLSMRASSHGYLGFAAMASPTLGEALETAARFAPTRTDAVALRTHVGGGVASVVIEELVPLGAARDVLILGLLVGLQEIGEALTGRRMEGSADVALPEPAHLARFEHLVHGGIRFGQPAHQLVFDAAVLDLPLAMADPVALRLAREQCERELDALGYEGHASARVRAILPQAGRRLPLPRRGRQAALALAAHPQAPPRGRRHGLHHAPRRAAPRARAPPPPLPGHLGRGRRRAGRLLGRRQLHPGLPPLDGHHAHRLPARRRAPGPRGGDSRTTLALRCGRR